MSATKNEHNPDGLPEMEGFRFLCIGEEFRPGDEYWDRGAQRWLDSWNHKLSDHPTLGETDFTYRRRITPPTDTTGSGMEGETPETDAKKRELCQRSKVDSDLPNDWNDIVPADFARQLERQRDAALAKNADLLKSENDQLADIDALTSHITTDVDAPETSGSVVEKVEWLLAQVEALRRDGERDGINYPVTVDAKLLRSLIWTGDAIVREPNQGRLAAWRELREKVCAQMKDPAIDSAQRQEGR